MIGLLSAILNPRSEHAFIHTYCTVKKIDESSERCCQMVASVGAHSESASSPSKRRSLISLIDVVSCFFDIELLR